MQRIAAQIVAVQKGHMHRIDTALECLEPVALLGALGTNEAVGTVAHSKFGGGGLRSAGPI